MSLPPALMSDGYPKTLHLIRLALEKRLTNQTLRMSYTPSYHRGTPDPAALPKEKLGIWLDWVRQEPDEEEPYEATMLVTRFKCFIVAEDEGNDNFGTDSPLAERVWGDVLKTLTEKITDLGLDGSCDYVPTPTADNFRGTMGDRRVQVIELDIAAHWAMELIRRPEDI